MRHERPRLASHVLVRFHVASGEKKVVLHDPRGGALLEIAPEDWRLLEQMDGTRDLDALCLAATRVDAYVSEAEIVQLVNELDDAGVMVDGLMAPAGEAPVEVPRTPPDRPLEPLPSFTLVCDGRGSCCRFYGGVIFRAAEAHRARAEAPALELGVPDAQLFTPMRGADAAACGGQLAVAQLDGRCAFLDGAGLCRLHALGGADHKPLACRIYPAAFVDDGEAVRVSLGPECACVFASRGRTDGSPLIDPAATTAADLPEPVITLHVPDPVPLSATRTATRPELRRWSTRAHDELRSTRVDAAAWAWAAAQTVERGELGERVIPDATEGIAPWLDAFGTRARRIAETHDGWRGASDLSRRVAIWIADALDRGDPYAAPTRPDDERFYLAALAWGHRLAVEGRPLAHGLRDRATRILTARAMATVEPPDDAASEAPLALVEAAVRNLSIAGYADDLDP